MSQPLTRTQLCTLAVVQFFRDNPDRWCRQFAAKTAYGQPCSPDWPGRSRLLLHWGMASTGV